MRLSKFRKILRLTFVAALLSAAEAVMIKAPLSDLVEGAEAIVLGRVQSLQCTWSLDQSLIVTIVTFKVQEVLKGPVSGPLIILQIPGGLIGDIGLKVSDTPSFRQDEKALIFLKMLKDPNSPKNSHLAAQNSRSAYEVFERAQGKFAIDEAGMAEVSGYELPYRDNKAEKPLPLTELKTKIKALLRRAPSSRGKSHEK